MTSETKLNDINWYNNRFQPYLQQFHKGAFVFTYQDVAQEANNADRFASVTLRLR